MESLSQRISKTPQEVDIEDEITVSDEAELNDKEHPDLNKIKQLLESGNASEAFFLARRLVASGEDWAAQWLEKAQQEF
jgi:hypothetical protein